MSEPVKWYHKTGMIVTAFLCVGPLALPLVWMHPRYNLQKKIIGTVLMVGASWILWTWMKSSFDHILAQYREMETAMKGY